MSTSTRTVYDGTKILDTKEVDGDSIEVCVSGHATLDETSSEMVLEIDSFLRRFEMRGKDEVWHAPWLPKKDMVHTHVSADEATEAAKEIFKSWGEKVKRCIPSLGEWKENQAWLPSHSPKAR